ncbi:MAG: hypothetical protein U0359_08300 [Byssovorax sp.]
MSRRWPFESTSEAGGAAGPGDEVTQKLDPQANGAKDPVVPFARAALPGSGPASLPKSDTPWGPPSFQAPRDLPAVVPGGDETTVPLPDHRSNRAFDLRPDPRPPEARADHRRANEPAQPAPPPTADLGALRKKAGRGKLSPDEVAAFARAFALPPARKPS